MRNNPHHSMDGFIPRSGSRRLGDAEMAKPLQRMDDDQTSRPLGVAQEEVSATGSRVSKADVDTSLQAIDQEYQPEKRRFWQRKPKTNAPPTRKQKLKKRLIIGLIVLLVAIGAFIGIKALLASSNIFQGNLLGLFQNKPLKTDANGRSNILVFGTSGSVKDQRHDGALLTDTLLVLSIDQKKKDAYMVSLPRDLYVDYGSVCPEGYQGKINSMYSCFSNSGNNEKAGARALERKIKDVTGLSMQYYAHINWAVVVGAVNAVGGVTVNVKGDGSCAGYGLPEGSIYDVNMKIRYKPGNHAMNGEQALRFSRARGSAGGCGLDKGDYNRQANQQKVIKALQAKAISAETLTNIGKVTSLIDALGQNLRTDFDTSEIRTLMSLGREIPADKIVSLKLVGGDKDLLGGEMINGASVQLPTAGQFTYSEIKAYIRRSLTSDAAVRENAKLAVYNGSGMAGYAQQKADILTERGYTVSVVDNAPVGKYGYVKLYDVSKDKPATKKKLEILYGKTAQTSSPPIVVPSGIDIVLIYGKTN